MYNKDKKYSKYRSAVFFIHDLNTIIHIGLSIKFIIYGVGINPETNNKSFIGYAQFRDRELAEPGLAEELGVLSVSCRIPLDSKSQVIDSIRKLVDTNTLVIDGVPYLGKVGRPRKIITPIMINSVHPSTYIREYVNKGWSYKDFSNHNIGYAIRYMNTIDYEVGIKNLDKLGQGSSTSTRVCTRRDLLNIIDLIKAGHSEDDTKLYFPCMEKYVTLAYIMYELINDN